MNLTIGSLLTTNNLNSINNLFGGTLNLHLSGGTSGGEQLISYGNNAFSGSFTTVNLNGTPDPSLASSLQYTANALELPGGSSFSGTAAWATGAGNWSVGPWSPNTAPTKAGNTAILNNASSPLVSVVLDVPVSVGTLVLGNTDSSPTSGFSISSTGGYALTMDNSGSTSHIIVQGGTHVISAPITLAGNLSVAPTAGSTLTLSGDIGQNTNSALSLDDAGTLILSGSNGYSEGTLVNAGALVVENPNGIPNGSSLTVGAGAASLFGAPAAGGVVLGGAEIVVAGGNSASAPPAVPEPGTLALLLAAAAGAALYSRTGRRSKTAARQPRDAR